MKKKQLWSLLVEKDLVEDKKQATAWILAGKVFVNSERAVHPGEKVDVHADFTIKGLNKRFAGKGGLKLEAAIKQFNIDLAGKTVLDSGASTGGFTDCLLQYGAEKVYAVEAGFGQLAGKLRVDDRVINMEKTNISAVSAKDLIPMPSVAALDFSYLSLKKGIPIVEKLLPENGDMICLVKPLFEVNDSAIRRTGEITHAGIYKDILSELTNYVESLNLHPLGIIHSPVTGNNGTVEFFLWLSKQRKETGRIIKNDIDKAVTEGSRLKKYKE